MNNECNPAPDPKHLSPGACGLDGPMPDAALVLVGHGSTVNAESSTPVRRLVERIRALSHFGTVRSAFLLEEPGLPGALAGLNERRVFVVPFFISEGYFCEEVVPHALGFRQSGAVGFDRVRTAGHQTFHYCKPVGTSERMTDVVLSRAREVVAQGATPRQPPEPDITLFLAGHGTPRNAESRRSIERQVGFIREKADYAAVDAMFMEEEPRIAEAWKRAGTANVVIVPYFLSDGMHVREDIPVLLGEHPERVGEALRAGRPTWRNPTQRGGKSIWYAGAVGSDPVVADVVLDRVREAARWAER